MIMETIAAIAAMPYEVTLPDPTPTQPPGTQTIDSFMGWIKWIGLAMCAVGIIMAGAMMGINHRRGEGGEHVARLGWAIGGVIVIGAAVTIVGFLA